MAEVMAEKRMKLALIFGGRSGEHEVSLMSARSVLSVLDPDKYDVVEIGVTPQGEWLTGRSVIDRFAKHDYSSLSPVILLPEPRGGELYLVKKDSLESLGAIDIAFPLIHGTFGEDGTLQGLLELADLAYIGCGVLASAVGMDKSLFKDVMRANHIPVVDSLLFSRKQLSQDIDAVLREIEASIPYPVFVKPVNLGSSVGITKCASHSSLLEGLLEACRFDRRVLVERGVNAREIEVSVLGNEDPIASVPGEIQPREEFYTYTAKYITNESRLVIPAELDAETTEEIRRIAVKAFKAIDGAGLARVDFLLDRDSGEILLSEINTIPGFTSISMYAKLWEASGLSYVELIDRLIELALERKQDRDNTLRTYGSDE
jgi:D-alanine-D-alanine ligase